MFGHGHSARADVAVNINLALRHGIGHAVGRVAVHNDFRAGIEPADIVGGRTEYFNDRIGKTHRSETLTGRTQYIDFNLLVAGSPQASADAVLTISGHFNLPIPIFHGFLNALFQNPRFNADIIFHTGNFY